MFIALFRESFLFTESTKVVEMRDESFLGGLTGKESSRIPQRTAKVGVDRKISE